MITNIVDTAVQYHLGVMLSDAIAEFELNRVLPSNWTHYYAF